MVDAYSLVFAGMLFTAGTLGDRFGRKGALQAGLRAVPGRHAAAPPSADSSTEVIGARAVMGLGRRLRHAVDAVDPHQRLPARRAPQGHRRLGRHRRRRRRHRPDRLRLPARALLVGLGVPRQRAGHHRARSSPARILLPTSRDPEQPPLDIPGALLSIVGLGSLVYGIIEGPQHGWTSPETPRHLRRRRRRPRPVRPGGSCTRRAPDARPALLPGPALQRGLRRHDARSSSPCSARSSSCRSTSSWCSATPPSSPACSSCRWRS